MIRSGRAQDFSKNLSLLKILELEFSNKENGISTVRIDGGETGRFDEENDIKKGGMRKIFVVYEII